MSIQTNPTTDITPIVEAINALQEQHTREYEQTINLLKSVVEEMRGIRKELQAIKGEELEVIKKLVGGL